ncbi:fungal-specific transcription factor domain-containing protein [Dipodascopsis uninucleata]
MPSRKRRRSRKGLEKIFECDSPGCGKKFTRSEHLARHQLNHQPKEIFKCDWHGCTRLFVREDLRARHIARHKRRLALDNGGAGSVSSPRASSDILLNDMDTLRSMTNNEKKLPTIELEAQMKDPAASSTFHYDSNSPLGSTDLTASFKDTRTTTSDELISEDPNSNTVDLINWLFSDNMMSNSRDLFMFSNSYSSFESPMDLPNMLTPPSQPQPKTMSESKRLDILGLIPSLETCAGLDLFRVQQYISVYFERFHYQFPILHKPSFEADSVPGPLLWAVIMIGAEFSREHDIALKIAEPLRWVIFASPGFHPPTRVYIIQSLLLLEVFEKSMSTRRFHERAHIHHGTTIQLIRRGSTCLGNSRIISTSSITEDIESNNYSFNPESGSDIWNRFVEAETAKRAAYMAFILDVSHATVFTHSALMSAHEMRLSLPCDEDVWESIPANRNSLLRNPTMPFLKALKKLLNQESVPTGRFGSVVLLCGLMSLLHQMEQLDMQVSSLGWGAFRETWRATISSALDFWKAEYDRRITSYSAVSCSSTNIGSNVWSVDNEALCKVLVEPMWHMAHIYMRAPIYEMHMFCGVHRILGRSTKEQDYLIAKKRVYDWAISDRAPDAVLHSIRVLYKTFVQGNQVYYERQYKASEDDLIHRSGILLICAQIVWAYGYCIDGVENSILGVRDRAIGGYSPDNDGPAILAAEDGRHFLERMWNLNSGTELQVAKDKNLTVGMLRLVASALRECHWELLDEAQEALDICIQRSMGREESLLRAGKVYVN